MSAGRRDPTLARFDALQRAAAVAGALGGSVRARSIRLDELGALLGALEAVSLRPDATDVRAGTQADDRPGPSEGR